MKKLSFLSIVAAVVLLGFGAMVPIPALAQGTINLQPVAASLADVVLSAGVAVAVALMGVFVHDAKANSMRSTIQSALEAAADYAVEKVKSADWANLNVKSKIVAEGVNYMFKHVPKALKFFGITQEKLKDELAEKVLARLSKRAAVSAVLSSATAIE